MSTAPLADDKVGLVPPGHNIVSLPSAVQVILVNVEPLAGWVNFKSKLQAPDGWDKKFMLAPCKVKLYLLPWSHWT